MPTWRVGVIIVQSRSACLKNCPEVELAPPCAFPKFGGGMTEPEAGEIYTAPCASRQHKTHSASTHCKPKSIATLKQHVCRQRASEPQRRGHGELGAGKSQRNLASYCVTANRGVGRASICRQRYCVSNHVPPRLTDACSCTTHRDILEDPRESTRLQAAADQARR
jgi:hypothetical protein